MKKLSTVCVVIAGFLCGTLGYGQTRGIASETVSGPGGSQKWAIIIGVSRYDDGAFGGLPNAANDAKAIYTALTQSPNGFSAKNCILITDDAADAGHRPTRANILTMVGQWASLAGPDDSLLVYFAGHGVESGGSLFLVPSDGRGSSIDFTGVAFKDFEAMLKRSQAKKSIVILDACHSGAGRGSTAMSPEMMKDIEQGSEGHILLASCKENEFSHEYDEQRHGAFTWFLLNGIGGAADADADGTVSALELSRYTFEEVRRWAASKGYQQTPRLLANISGDIVLNSVGATPVPLPAPAMTDPAPGGSPAVAAAPIASALPSGDPNQFLKREYRPGFEYVVAP